MVNERCSGSFTIATGNTNLFRLGVPCSKLNLGDNWNPCLPYLIDDRCFVGNTWTFDYLITTENLLLGMLTLLPRDLILVEQLLVLGFNGSEIG